jgi:site-specific DNA-cytosine methylase
MPAQMAVGAFEDADDPLLPIGLDSHRYRCCGNGVVSNVAEAIGRALLSVMEAERAA